ncbi:MAG: glycosyltransferase family 9 protein [Gemmatimonadota bacterium]
MERFEDQPLGERPHLAVFSSTKVGNFVVLTPLLRGLKEKYPGAVLDFFGSEVTRGFEEADPNIDFRHSLYGEADFLPAFLEALRRRREAYGPYDLAINCDEFAELNLVAVTALAPRYIAGAALAPGLTGKLPPGRRPEQRMLQDPDWNSPEFLQRYAEVLETNYIAEIFCRMAYVRTDYFRLQLGSAPPSFVVPDVLLHVTTTRSAKMWLLAGWQRVADWCRQEGLSMGLIGSAPDRQRALYHAGEDEDRLLEGGGIADLRGRTPLLELAGALERARALVTVDAGPLHVAAAVGCPTVALFGNDEAGHGASPLHLWAPRVAHVRVVRSRHQCRVCEENRFRNEGCLVAGHPCMRELSTEDVLAALAAALADGQGRSHRTRSP